MHTKVAGSIFRSPNSAPYQLDCVQLFMSRVYALAVAGKARNFIYFQIKAILLRLESKRLCRLNYQNKEKIRSKNSRVNCRPQNEAKIPASGPSSNCSGNQVHIYSSYMAHERRSCRPDDIDSPSTKVNFGGLFFRSARNVLFL